MDTRPLAATINLAMLWKWNLWAWLAVVVATALVAGTVLWLDRRHAAGSLDEDAAGGPSVNPLLIGGTTSKSDPPPAMW